jgi:hypothetical protein
MLTEPRDGIDFAKMVQWNRFLNNRYPIANVSRIDIDRLQVSDWFAQVVTKKNKITLINIKPTNSDCKSRSTMIMTLAIG